MSYFKSMQLFASISLISHFFLQAAAFTYPRRFHGIAPALCSTRPAFSHLKLLRVSFTEQLPPTNFAILFHFSCELFIRSWGKSVHLLEGKMLKGWRLCLCLRRTGTNRYSYPLTKPSILILPCDDF